MGILLSVIGTNVAMFITGRLLTGWSSGMILPVSAIYMAEVSKPQNRGIVVGFQGMGTAMGFFLANWIGYSGIFFEGNLQWRFPLSLQFPCAVLMLVGSIVILPFTPRWLVSQDRFEEARAVLARIHSDEGEEFIDQEMIQIREQTALERSYKRVGGEKWYSNFLMLFTKQYIKRLGFVCFIQALTQFGGVTVIQNYQNIFYGTVGFTGDTALLISGIYGIMGLTGQIINLLVVAGKSNWRGLEKRLQAMADALLRQTVGAEPQHCGWAVSSSQSCWPFVRPSPRCSQTARTRRPPAPPLRSSSSTLPSSQSSSIPRCGSSAQSSYLFSSDPAAWPWERLRPALPPLSYLKLRLSHWKAYHGDTTTYSSRPISLVSWSTSSSYPTRRARLWRRLASFSVTRSLRLILGTLMSMASRAQE